MTIPGARTRGATTSSALGSGATAGPGGAHPDGAHAVGPLGEGRRLVLGAAEELDERRAGGREALGHLVGHRGVVVGSLPLEAGQAGAHPARRHDEHRQQHEGEQSDLPGDAQHHREGQRQRHEVAEDARQRVAEGLQAGFERLVAEDGHRDEHEQADVEHGDEAQHASGAAGARAHGRRRRDDGARGDDVSHGVPPVASRVRAAAARRR